MRNLHREEKHLYIYYFSLALLAISIPLSPFMLSVSLIILSLNWIIEGDFKNKIHKLIFTRSIWVFSLFFLIYIIWLINTENISRGFHEIRIKLPFLALAIVVSTSKPLKLNEIKYILLFFILAVTANTFIGTFVLFFFKKAYYNIREISIFISHIRFSLMILISIGCLIYFIFSDNISKTKNERNVYIILLIWLTTFLFILRSFTGIFLFVLLTIPLLLWIKNRMGNKNISRVIYALSFMFIGYIVYNAVVPAKLYFKDNKPEINKLEKYTVNGNIYTHDHRKNERENGNYIWYYVCGYELCNEWEKRSNIPYHGFDKNGNMIYHTLIRYLTSKGLTKDSLGLSKLSPEEIKFIENGVANYIYSKKFAVYPRIYEIIWEIDNYMKGMDPSGHSLSQRLEYIKTGLLIINDYFWFGVGTGDLTDAFDKKYTAINTELNPKSRLNTHNQFLTFFITFGFVGSMIILIIFVYPIIKNRRKLFLPTYIFLFVLFFSMFNEDTLESHVGISLFSFFYSLLILGFEKTKNSLNINETISLLKPFFTQKI